MVSSSYILGLTETSEAQRGEVICPGSHSKEQGLYGLVHRLAPHQPQAPAWRAWLGPADQLLLTSSFPTGERAQGMIPAVVTPVSVTVGLGLVPWSV